LAVLTGGQSPTGITVTEADAYKHQCCRQQKQQQQQQQQPHSKHTRKAAGISSWCHYADALTPATRDLKARQKTLHYNTSSCAQGTYVVLAVSFVAISS
jgi:hypothetical protein